MTSLLENRRVLQLQLKNDFVYLENQRIFDEVYNGEHIRNYVYGIKRTEDQRLIGFCDLRVGDPKALLYLGNIGYSIFENYRGHHYAYYGTLLLKELALTLDIDMLSITVNPDNWPSIKTIDKLGATFIKRIPVPSYEPLFSQGDYEKLIFHWFLKEDHNG